MLEKVKQALRLTVNAYDTELTGLIQSALADLGLVNAISTSEDYSGDALVMRAVITFCRFNFGSPDDYERLKASYDEQKKQLLTARNYGLRDFDGTL